MSLLLSRDLQAKWTRVDLPDGYRRGALGGGICDGQRREGGGDEVT